MATLASTYKVLEGDPISRFDKGSFVLWVPSGIMSTRPVPLFRPFGTPRSSSSFWASCRCCSCSVAATASVCVAIIRIERRMRANERLGREKFLEFFDKCNTKRSNIFAQS